MRYALKIETPRPIRVAVPVLVSFSSDAYAVRDFSLDLSEGGIFLPTDKICPVGTLGTLKFRVSQFDEPFDLEAEVVRTVEPGTEREGQQAGLGMRFLELDDRSRKRLQRLVEGVSNGSVVDAIRRSIREGDKNLEEELRGRPVDQKLMLALTATNQEIRALIREANPTVQIRLLDCPRLTMNHVATILRMPNTSVRVLQAVRKSRKWLVNDETRWLFCTHPATPLNDAMAELSFLSEAKQREMARKSKGAPADPGQGVRTGRLARPRPAPVGAIGAAAAPCRAWALSAGRRAGTRIRPGSAWAGRRSAAPPGAGSGRRSIRGRPRFR